MRLGRLKAAASLADCPGMIPLDRLRRVLRTDHDALADRRDRIARGLSLPAAVLMVPFTVGNLLAGRWLLGGLDLAAQLALFVNA